MKIIDKNTLLLASAGCAIIAASQANAGGFALREQSAYYQGMSFAGYGTSGGSISSMFWNPASMTGVGDGVTVEMHGSLVLPYAKFDDLEQTGGIFAGSGGSGNVGQDALLPAGYVAYRLNEDAVFGISVNAPFGLTTKPNPGWVGEYYAGTSKAHTTNVTPMLSYDLSDQLTIGAGVQVQYSKITLRSTVPLTGGKQGTLEGDDVAFGAVAGLTFKPREGTEIGIGYRSNLNHNLNGHFDIADSSHKDDISAPMDLPEQVNISLMQVVNDDIRAYATAEWTNWSRFGTFPVEGTAAIEELPFNYSDGWFVSVGGEYDYSDDLTLRAGIGYEWSPVDEEHRSARLPDTDRLWLSAGLSFSPMENMYVDFAYTHLFGASDKLKIVDGHQDYEDVYGDLTADVDAHVDIVSAALRFNF